MKEDILDLIIVETNKDLFKIRDDYFSKIFKIKIFNSLEVNPQKTEDLKRQIDNLNKLFFKHKVGSVEELLLIKEEINSFL